MVITSCSSILRYTAHNFRNRIALLTRDANEDVSCKINDPNLTLGSSGAFTVTVQCADLLALLLRAPPGIGTFFGQSRRYPVGDSTSDTSTQNDTSLGVSRRTEIFEFPPSTKTERD